VVARDDSGAAGRESLGSLLKYLVNAVRLAVFEEFEQRRLRILSLLLSLSNQ
jgi:hypothetical protein